MYLQRQDSTFLDLDTKWVVIASIPLLVAILRSNIIRRFQGFGIELETRLEVPVGHISLVATDAIELLPGQGKESLEKLYSLDTAKRREIRRLNLIQGRVATYAVGALQEYIEKLPELKFLEVRDEAERFIALLPVSQFRVQGSVDTDQLDNLIRSIENRSVLDVFRSSAITESVRADESFLTVLPKVRESKFGSLPVTSSNGQLLGIVTTEIVEKRIADAVIAAQRHA